MLTNIEKLLVDITGSLGGRRPIGVPVLVIGESGSGKTYSLKNFEANEVTIFSVEKSRLPFQKKLPLVARAGYDTIQGLFSKPLTKKVYVIDDSQYLLVNEMFKGMEEHVNGFEVYKNIALNFRNLIHGVNFNLPDDVIVYFLHHSEKDNDGTIKAKSVGKMLDEKLSIPGCFDLVLYARMDGDKHIFQTQSDGFAIAKSPEGMFEKIIPNDLKAVDTRIREYYGFTEEKPKNEKEKK